MKINQSVVKKLGALALAAALLAGCGAPAAGQSEAQGPTGQSVEKPAPMPTQRPKNEAEEWYVHVPVFWYAGDDLAGPTDENVTRPQTDARKGLCVDPLPGSPAPGPELDLAAMGWAPEWGEADGRRVRGCFVPSQLEYMLAMPAAGDGEAAFLYAKDKGDGAYNWEKTTLALEGMPAEEKILCKGVDVISANEVIFWAVEQPPEEKCAERPLHIWHLRRDENGLPLAEGAAHIECGETFVLNLWRDVNEICFVSDAEGYIAYTQLLSCTTGATDASRAGYSPQPCVMRTKDGGETWQDVDLSALFDENGKTGWRAVRVRGDVGGRVRVRCAAWEEPGPETLELVSKDGGETWQAESWEEQARGLPQDARYRLPDSDEKQMN